MQPTGSQHTGSVGSFLDSSASSSFSPWSSGRYRNRSAIKVHSGRARAPTICSRSALTLKVELSSAEDARQLEGMLKISWTLKLLTRVICLVGLGRLLRLKSSLLFQFFLTVSPLIARFIERSIADVRGAAAAGHCIGF